MIRPVLDHRLEIWGDLSQTRKDKLDSIQHRALVTFFCVHRLSHKKDVNVEAGVIPLEMRRTQTRF